MIYYDQGNYEYALMYFEQSLPVSREANNNVVEGRALNNIGTIYRKRGKYTESLVHYEQALGIFRNIRDRVVEANTCKNIGRTYEKQGDLAKAEEYMSKVVQIAEDIGHPSLEKWRERLEQVRAKLRGA